MEWKPRSLVAILKAPLDLSTYVYMDLLKAVRPQSVTLTQPLK